MLCNKFMKNYQAAQRSVVMLQQVAKEAEDCKKEALLYLLRKVPCEEAAAGSARPSTVLQLADDKSSVVLEDLT